jgi:hypothetical protein
VNLGGTKFTLITLIYTKGKGRGSGVEGKPKPSKPVRPGQIKSKRFALTNGTARSYIARP